MNELVNKTVRALAPSFIGCYAEEWLNDAQPKTPARKALFGNVINAPVIMTESGAVVSIAENFDTEVAQNIASLIIYRLQNPGVIKNPTPVKLS